MGSTQKNSSNRSVPSRFQICIQHARDTHTVKSCGPSDYDGFLATFRAFDWLHETNQSFWSRSPPMISAKNMETGTSISVTSHDVLSAAVSYKEPNAEGWIDFIVVLNAEERSDTASEPQVAFSTPRGAEVEEAYRLFFLESYESLHRHLSTLSQVTLIDRNMSTRDG